MRKYKHLSTGIIGELHEDGHIHFERCHGDVCAMETIHSSFLDSSKDWLDITDINMSGTEKEMRAFRGIQGMHNDDELGFFIGENYEFISYSPTEIRIRNSRGSIVTVTRLYAESWFLSTDYADDASNVKIEVEKSEIPIKNIGSAYWYGPNGDELGLTQNNEYPILERSKDGTHYSILNNDNIPVTVNRNKLSRIIYAEIDREDPHHKYDHVNPDHYKTNDKEVWEYMIEIYGLEKFIAFCELNVFKYSMRVGRKPGATVEDDLGKIKWYAEKIKELRDDKGA